METYSPDMFLDKIDLVVIFLDGGLVTLIPNYDSKGRWHESGDLIYLDTEPVIILGWGESEDEAVRNARSYFHRLIKWHNGDARAADVKVEFFGHDLAQSELLNPTEHFTDEFLNLSSSSQSDLHNQLAVALKKRKK